MRHTRIDKSALKQKSEELGIPFSNLLAGYVLEELMYLIEDSPFSLFLWLKNSSIFGVEQYRRRNLLTLEFGYVTDKLAMKKEGIAPGQELSLKMGYVMLAHILKVEKVPEISWKGRADMKGDALELEIMGELEDMAVPIHIRVTKLTEEGLVPVRREFPLFMEKNRCIPYLEYPVESILAEQLFIIIKDMELLPEMRAYDIVYEILNTDTIDARHIREMLLARYKREQLVLQEGSVDEILGYRNYTYMRRRWEKYLRHHKKSGPAWEELLEVIEKFLPRIWNSICMDEVVFGDWMPDLGRYLD